MTKDRADDASPAVRDAMLAAIPGLRAFAISLSGILRNLFRTEHRKRRREVEGALGFSYEEAAAICESAVGTIKSRVNRARTRLSKLLSIDSADRVPF
jgi:DNA-directed RNA polymerase specialized sigma24 family protein